MHTVYGVQQNNLVIALQQSAFKTKIISSNIKNAKGRTLVVTVQVTP